MNSQREEYLVTEYLDDDKSLVNWIQEMRGEMQEIRNQSLGQEDPLRKEMATHSSILVLRIPWPEEPDGLLTMGFQRVRCD